MEAGSRSRESGFVLLLTLLLVIVLGVVVVEFYYKSRIELHLSENLYRGTQARCAAEGGIAVASEILEQSRRLWEDKAVWALASGLTSLRTGEGRCTLQITSEGGKINLNRLKTDSGELDRERIEQLLRVIDLYNARALDHDQNTVSYGVVAAMIDWVDIDDEVTVLPFASGDNRGAEQRDYAQLDNAYECKNGPFETLSEVLLVKGMTEEILYGVPDLESGVLVAGLEASLTVYGSSQIDINYASPLVIQSLSEYCDSMLAEAIVAQRPYTRMDQFREVPGMVPEVYQALTRSMIAVSQEQYFSVSATGSSGTTRRTIRSIVKRNERTGTLEPLMRWEL